MILHYFQCGIEKAMLILFFIISAQKLPAILAQVQVNQADLSDAVAANQNAGTGTAVQNLAAANRKFILLQNFKNDLPDIAIEQNCSLSPLPPRPRPNRPLQL